MVYLLLAIASSAMIAIIMRISARWVRGSISMLAVNYLTCLLLGAGFAGFQLFDPGQSGLPVTVAMGGFNGLVYLAGATHDAGMDPKSEFLSCLATNPVYEMLGEKGLVCDDKMPEVGQGLYEGNVGFHYREGGHALSREDWLHYMVFLELQLEKH